MAFTVKATVNSVERQGDQVKIRFGANYTDPETGARQNEEWAAATPAFTCEMWVIPEVAKRDDLKIGDQYTLTFAKD